jgi:putative adenylate-forming enzyme
MRFKFKIIFYWLKILSLPRFDSREKIERHHAKQLKKFARNVLTKSDYYKPFIKNGELEMPDLPIISKTEFMSSFNEINTKGILLEEALHVAIEAENSRDFKSEINGITVGLSTGTSGKRAVFLASEDERAIWVALVMNRVIKPKIFKRQKIAFFLRANSNLYSSVESSLFEFKYFDIFKPMSELLQEINEYQPDILASQPSILIDIAEAQKKQVINIQPIQIISFAEVLHESDKIELKKVFDSKLSEVYQCTEGFLGVSCAYGTMHLNEDFIHFDKEWIDDNLFYPIITDFSRHSQPVVKHKLNDILQIKKDACLCGSKFIALEKIIGRDDDVLIFSGKKIYPDLISRRIALETNSFNKYTITQAGPMELQIGIECDPTIYDFLTKAFQSVLVILFEEFEISGVNYDFQNKVDYTTGSKLRKIKRLNYGN